MKNLDLIAEELFNKIRGRFPKVTLGDESSTITNVPNKARFFDFDFVTGSKVNITVDEDALTVMYSNDLLSDAENSTKESWFGFMKELRQFAKKRMLKFDTRDITKTNLDRRDYQYLSTNRPGDEQMSESKMYGTSRTSFQDVGEARLVVKHRNPIDQQAPAGRTQQIDSIYIESADGERFKYPYRHLNGARAMAMHVSEGGNAYDSFGKHIVSLSEELSKLRQFKTYMNRSSVMAEGLVGYLDIVNERIETVKETIFKLQRQNYYKEAFESFEETVMEEVPEDVSSTWIDELTIRQFNEELKGVFPYIYKLVKEGSKSKVVGPEDLLGETEEEEVAVEQNTDTERYSMEDEYASHLDNVVTNSKHEQGPVQEGESVEDFMTKIANSDDGYELMDQGLRGKHGPEIEKALMDMYNDVSTDHGLHPDDDFEQIHDRMIDNITDDYGTNEGNEFAQKVQALKAKGAKPGTKFKTSDGEEHTLEDAIRLAGLQVEDFWTAEELMAEKGADDDTMDVKIDKDGAISKADAPDELHDKEEELPLDEFIKGHFDYTTNQFPKGETAVMTAVEKKYGDEAMRDAMNIMKELVTNQDEEMARIKTLAGLAH